MKISLFIFSLLLLSACSNEATNDPQKAAQVEPAVAPAAAPESAVQPEAEPEDAYLWLEDVEGEEALAWVEEQNDISLAYLEALPVFETLNERNLEIYNSDERIPTPAIRGDHVLNFWRDAEHKRGLWRRAPIEAYLAGEPEWEILLDIDALAAREGEDWVWKGSSWSRRNRGA